MTAISNACREFIHSGYYDLVLLENPASRRLLDLKATRKLHGRLKVDAVAAADEHAIEVIMRGERSGAKLRLEMAVGENYPHPILHYALRTVDDE